jgi:hypothetical protein
MGRSKAVADWSPQNITENQLNHDDRNPKQTLSSHSHSPVGEGTHDLRKTSAGSSETEKAKIMRMCFSVIFGP